jgi:hypothetical protein
MTHPLATKIPAAHPDRVRRKYESLIGPLREEAQRLGYAIGVHGSLARDIDLIACPWTEAAVPPPELAEALRKKAERLNDGVAFLKPPEDDEFFQNGCPGLKPHGRLTWSIQLGGTYLDLSVLPLLPEL